MTADPLEYVDTGTAFSLAGAIYLILAIWAGFHVILHKRNEASAFSWLGIIVLAPLIGAVLYWLFGINRIRRRAQAELPDHTSVATQRDELLCVCMEALPLSWQERMNFGVGVHEAPYLAGNALTPLINGDEAYPQMLTAIEQAKNSVVLSSYIFEFDEIGRQFVSALVNAHRRGVMVRVMIDGLGVGYGLSLVRADRVLRSQGVKTARFLSALSTNGTRFINLRNHRKILSVDGHVAFVGGMNIRDNNLLNGTAAHKTQDVHFKVHGPVINQINHVFAADWEFASEEHLELPRWCDVGEVSPVASRVLLDGPDDNFQKLKLTILGAVQSAKNRVCVVSPYFLPDKSITSALQLAVLRGVKVDVCVPKKNNLLFVGWAMQANQAELLEMGVNLYESPDPFDHSKLFVVDDSWCLVGSSNWDARSLELNFEINLECYDTGFNSEVTEIIDKRLADAVQILHAPDHQFLVRVRNNFFRLFSPYL
ncbi:MAG: phospholipase D-like domain-containing protein [Granulosicoccus sp.]